METAFTKIYDKNIWGGSGTGSKMSRNNQHYIDQLQAIIHKEDIKTICDIGCGDWEFSRTIDFQGKDYLGIDCVQSVIKEVEKKYKKKGVRFEYKEVGKHYIPKGFDLIIVKDVIQHWTDEDILSFFGEILDKNKYVYCTNGYKFMRDPKKNALTKRDITNVYRYHPVDIAKLPLSKFKDHCISTTTYHSKQMNLFKKTIM